MNLHNLGPPCCMLRPKMMRNSWTLRGRLQNFLARGLFQEKKKGDEIMNKKRKTQR